MVFVPSTPHSPDWLLALAAAACLALGGCDSTSTSKRSSTPNPASKGAVEVEGGASIDLPAGKELSQPKSNQETSRLVSWEEIQGQLQLGQLANAKQLIQQRLVELPDDCVAITWLAKIDSGNRGQAIDLLREIGIDTPEHGIPASGLLATWLIQEGEFDDALDRLRAILSRMPNEPLVHRQLAQVLNLMGRRQEAAGHIRKLCALGNVTQNELASLLSLRLPFDTRESEALSADRAQGKGTQWPSDLAQARELLKLGQSSAALSLMREHVIEMVRDQDKPRDPWMISLFGRTAVELNNDAAMTLWLNSLTADVTQCADHWSALGLLSGRPDIGRIEDAVKFCQVALSLDPTDWPTCGYLGSLQTQLGASDESEEYRNRALLIQSALLASNRLAAASEDLQHSLVIDDLVGALRKLDRDLEASLWTLVYSRHLIAKASDPGSNEAFAEEFRRAKEKYQKEQSKQATLLNEQDRLLALAGSLLSTVKESLSDEIESESIGLKRVASETAEDKRNVSIQWNTTSDNQGLTFRYSNANPTKQRDFQLYEQFGGGVAAFDFDRDGHVDLYFPQASGSPDQNDGTRPNELCRQVDHRFQSVTDRAGCDDRRYAMGISVGDLNQDGWDDLLVSNFGVNVFFINQGDGTFVRRMPESSLRHYWTSSIAVADLNNDSLPDFFEANYVNDPSLFEVPPRDQHGRYSVFKGPESYQAAVDRVFLANPQGGFRATELEANEAASPALGVVAGDFGENNQVDVYVANDMQANHYWTWENGAFRESAMIRGCAFGRQGGAGASMGIATGDFDGNGLIDFHVTNFLNEPVHHFLQTTSNVFLDGVFSAGLYAPTMPVLGFGTVATDIDNDCDDDLIVLNGHIEDLQFKDADFKMLPQCFVNTDGNFRLIPGDDLGDFFARKTLGRGLAALDWNADGRIDFVANHLDRPAVLVENITKSGSSWVQLILVGTSCERSAVGASVTVHAGDRNVKKWHVSGAGYSSHDESMLHVGLANYDGAVDLSVEWADGSSQSFSQVAAGRRHLIVQGQAEVWTHEGN
jgi:tetratricopeptide (TPR) repeat protein